MSRTEFPALIGAAPLRLESGVPAATRAALERVGWVIGGSDGGFGRYHCVEHRESEGHRIYGAASEMRADGLALACTEGAADAALGFTHVRRVRSGAGRPPQPPLRGPSG